MTQGVMKRIIGNDIEEMTQGVMIKDYWEQHQGNDKRGNDIGIIGEVVKR